MHGYGGSSAKYRVHGIVCTVYMYQSRVSFIRGGCHSKRLKGTPLWRSGGMPPDNFGFFSLLRLILVCDANEMLVANLDICLSIPVD